MASTLSETIDADHQSGRIVPADCESVRPDSCQPFTWQQEMKAAIRDPAELLRLLELPTELLAAAQCAAQQFGLFVPRPYLAKIRPGDPADPLLRQVLPVSDELAHAPGFTADAVGDAEATIAPGLLQKYHGRVLLVTTGACPVHCRYCFRRHFTYEDCPPSLDAWRPALRRIQDDSSIEEVILSGGDPLTLVDGTLADLTTELAAIDHVRRLRVHSRMPVMIPSRATDELLAWLTGTRLIPVFVIHANHPAELGEDVSAALSKLSGAGVPLLNQSVLLRGVNDDPAVLADLSRRLLDCRVMPYYLHQLDRVAGAAHFEVPEHEGLRLIADLQHQLPGYAVPRYVRESQGDASKQMIKSLADNTGSN